MKPAKTDHLIFEFSLPKQTELRHQLKSWSPSTHLAPLVFGRTFSIFRIFGNFFHSQHNLNFKKCCSQGLGQV